MNTVKTLKKFEKLEKENKIGILRRSFNFTDEPKYYQYSCISPNGKYESASIDENRNIAKIKALGEYLERYCLDNPERRLESFSYNQIQSIALDPALFINFRDSDMNFKREEYIEKIRNCPLRWIQGKNERNDTEVLIPAQAVYVDFPFEDEPILRPRISTGAATHESREEALYNGILENIERDSYMISYLSNRDLAKVDLTKNFSKIYEYFKRYLLDLYVFDTTTDLGIPSFMCLNIDKTGIGPAVSVGLKSSLNAKKAIEGCIKESQQVRQWIRHLWRENNFPEINSPEEIKSIEDRGFYWYPKNRIGQLENLINSSNIQELTELKSPIRSNQELVRHLHSKGIETYSVDIAHPFITEAGFFVIKTIQPQLHPLFLDESLPCYYSERLKNCMDLTQVNTSPHPFM